MALWSFQGRIGAGQNVLYGEEFSKVNSSQSDPSMMTMRRLLMLGVGTSAFKIKCRDSKWHRLIALAGPIKGIRGVWSSFLFVTKNRPATFKLEMSFICAVNVRAIDYKGAEPSIKKACEPYQDRASTCNVSDVSAPALCSGILAAIQWKSTWDTMRRFCGKTQNRQARGLQK